MENINTTLFLLLNASAAPPAWLLHMARFFAEDLIWLVPAGLVSGWLRHDIAIRRSLLQAALSGVVALLINQIIALAWTHPRPFMISLGHTFIPHVADSSFPSDHLTLQWSVGAALLWQGPTRTAGLQLGALGLPMAWARIYLGVHFPADMAGAVLVAMLAATSIHFLGGRISDSCCHAACRLYRRLFRPLILRGWVRP